jgi:hypothetical protein
MRTSTAVLLFSLAVSACATSESIDPRATLGGAMNPFADGAVPDAGNGGASVGGFPANGGFPSNGGFPANGGASPTGGTPATNGGANPTTGGAPNTGGAPPVTTGGAPNGGSSGAPQGGSAGSCSADEKVCGGICVKPAPSNGCGPQGCTACPTPAPTGGVQACVNGQCDFNCLSGYTKSGTTCTPPVGGAGGGGGLVCGGQTCTNPCPAATPCCKSAGGCGCNIFLLGCV